MTRVADRTGISLAAVVLLAGVARVLAIHT
jgi:hypothetical protein